MIEHLSERIKAVEWFHSIDLGHELTTPGRKPIEKIAQQAEEVFVPIDMQGASVIDIGAWNGAFSFEAKRRGATRVLAADHYAWVSDFWKGRLGFDLANEILGARIEAKEIDVPDITVERVGIWDVALFLGVLYHLPSPLEGLEAVAGITRDCLIVETHTDHRLLDQPWPAMCYYPSDSLNGDGSNYFGPNLAFVIEALKECGFVKFDSHHGTDHRLTVHAWRNTARRRLGDQPEVHSRIPELWPQPTKPSTPAAPRSFLQKVGRRFTRATRVLLRGA
jgi:tRNA (mo5U34)-methyltransferase